MPPFPIEAPDVDPKSVEAFAQQLARQGSVGRPALRGEATVLLMAGLATGHSDTNRLVRIALCEAAVRDALNNNEWAIQQHLPEFQRRSRGLWETPAFELLETPLNAPPGVRLRHLRIHDGIVPLTPDLLHFHAVAHLVRRVPDIPPQPWLHERFGTSLRVLTQVEKVKEERRRRWTALDDSPGDYPPCVRSWMADLAAGIHLKHFTRYNLMAFLGRIGWTSQRLGALFEGRSGYDLGDVKYQARHVKGPPDSPGYAPMGCDKLRSMGLCPDSSCPGPTPLSFYARKRHAALKPAAVKPPLDFPNNLGER